MLESLQLHKKSYDLQPHSISKNILCLEAKNKKETEKPQVKCRYILTLVGFWICFLIGDIRINTSVNIVAMVNQSAVAQWSKRKSDSCLPFLSNSSQIENTRDGEFVWSPEIQGYILGSYFLGYVIIQLPAGRLVERFGSKWFLFATTLITSVTTLLFPVFSWIGFPAVVALQLLRGLAHGFCQPAMSVLVANWFTRTDRGLLYSIIQSGGPLGLFLGSLHSGLQCDSFGRWPSSFYTAGSVGVAVSFMILCLVYENAEVHPTISASERDFILSNQETKLSTRRPNPPWRKILTSVPVYAMMFACFGQMWAISQFLVVHATFLGTILHYPIAQNGFLMSLTFLIQFVFAQAAVWISMLMIKKNIGSISFTRKFINFVACLGFSACLLGVYSAGCDRLLSIVFGILSNGFTGVGLSGVFIISAEMASTFAGILCALSFAAGCVASFILPLIVGYLTDDMRPNPSWCEISTSVPVYAMMFACFGQMWALFAVLERISNVHHVPNSICSQAAGWMSSLMIKKILLVSTLGSLLICVSYSPLLCCKRSNSGARCSSSQSQFP